MPISYAVRDVIGASSTEKVDTYGEKMVSLGVIVISSGRMRHRSPSDESGDRPHETVTVILTVGYLPSGVLQPPLQATSEVLTRIYMPIVTEMGTTGFPIQNLGMDGMIGDPSLSKEHDSYRGRRNGQRQRNSKKKRKQKLYIDG